MPLGRGWWVDGATGSFHEIFEHATAVRDDPERYGLAPESVSGLDPRKPAQRDALRLAAIRNGWIRVRFWKDRRVAELWQWTDDARRALAAFLDSIGAWDDDRIEIREHAEGRVRTVTAGEVRQWSSC